MLHSMPTVAALDSFAPSSLGSVSFRQDYKLRYAYLAGAMYKGIASPELVIAMGKAGFMGFLGTGGLNLQEVEAALLQIQYQLSDGQAYGMNLLADPGRSQHESRMVELYLRHGVRIVEAAAYMQITPSLVRFRLNGIRRLPSGSIEAPNRIVAKVSRPEIAELFMKPAPSALVQQLVQSGQLSAAEAALSEFVPMAQDICVEADSGGHTDQGVAYVLMPAMQVLRDQMMQRYRYSMPIRIGAAGGIGTPAAAAAAFILGADFIVTGSINQCTVEARTSDAVKDMLQAMGAQDTTYAPAGDMFELGAKVQVFKKGLFFPSRANKLHELYMRFSSLEEIDEKTQQQIQQKYFKRTFDQVWEETEAYYRKTDPSHLERIERNPKKKMALIFKWYFIHSTRLALAGKEEQRVDYQIQCGPALGAFNSSVRGTALENWRERRVAEIGARIMEGAARVLNMRIAQLQQAT
jgi:trans-AT polyketide synthase, acyltransferase and oxidoreductase domains